MPTSSEENKIDVLIIGAGPSGLMAGLWFAQLGIKTRIVDKRATKIINGHADGIHIRTVEIFDSFGLANRMLERSNTFVENCAWAPDENGGIHRVSKMSSFSSDTSRFLPQAAHQGHTEHVLIHGIQERSDIQIERGIEPSSFTIDRNLTDDPHAYPITVTLRHLKHEDIPTQEMKSHWATPKGQDTIHHQTDKTNINVNGYGPAGDEEWSEKVHAKYVIGCEGAHSWTRRQLGFEMQGESTDSIWGGVDIIPITNFPDIRKFYSIHSSAGSFFNIPRENKLVRVDVQLAEVGASESTGSYSHLTAKDIFARAQKIIGPQYKFEYSYCDWWTIFRVGQRVCNHYQESQRVFLGGDAVHTHTPKAGQGMNVSMQDTFNLCWKIAGALQGHYRPAVLESYEKERRAVAQHLIDFDRQLSETLDSQPSQDEVHKLYETQRRFLSGVVQYGESVLVDPSHGSLTLSATSKIVIGERFPSYPVIFQSTGCPCESQHWLKSDGQWSIMVFGGNIGVNGQLQRVNMLGALLAFLIGKGSMITTATRLPVRVYLLHCSNRDEYEMTDFHRTYFPFDENLGYNYDRIFTDAPSKDAHQFYGIDATEAGIVVARPDQHVGFVGGIDDVDRLHTYLGGIFASVSAPS